MSQKKETPTQSGGIEGLVAAETTEQEMTDLEQEIAPLHVEKVEQPLSIIPVQTRHYLSVWNVHYHKQDPDT